MIIAVALGLRHVDEQPREVLRQTGELVEAEANRDMSICCGGSLGSLTLGFDKREDLTRNALHNLTVNDPDTIVTACPLCKSTFARYADKPVEDIAETVETDVVVVGAGNGGLVAAASTADLGAKVILVEKNATWITWAGEMGAYNSKIMNEKYGISYTDEELLEISNEICRYAGYECDQRLINLWLFNSGRTMDWFTDRMEEKGIHMFLETDMKDTRYMNKPQTHTVYENFEELGPNQMGAQLANPKWVEIIEEKGGTIMWEHTAKQLVQDESGRVTGIIVQDKDGKYIQINAAKGVILSTGGYGGNPEMMDALHYRDKDVICNNLGCAFAMGDGIKMVRPCRCRAGSPHRCALYHGPRRYLVAGQPALAEPEHTRRAFLQRGQHL